MIDCIEDDNKVCMFSKDKCGFCIKSKSLLVDNNIPFTEIKLDPADLDYVKTITSLKNKSNGHSTFPFIFIGIQFLGGFTDLNHSLNTSLSEKLEKIGILYKPDLDF